MADADEKPGSAIAPSASVTPAPMPMALPPGVQAAQFNIALAQGSRPDAFAGLVPEVQGQLLRVSDAQDERQFKAHMEALQSDERIQSGERADRHAARKTGLLALGILGGMGFVLSVVLIATGNAAMALDLFKTLGIAVISALGGYGYGMKKGQERKPD